MCRGRLRGCVFVRKTPVPSAIRDVLASKEHTDTPQGGALAMNRSAQVDKNGLASEAEVIAPVTILDAEGRVLRVVPAEEFRQAAGAGQQPSGRGWRRERKRG